MVVLIIFPVICQVAAVGCSWGLRPLITVCLYLALQDVMVVGEPTLMGGEFGDKDERLIARLENTQYDPNEQPDEATGGDQSIEHCVRPIPGSTAPTTASFGAPPPTSFGAPPSVTVSQSRGRPCLTGSPTAMQGSWGMPDKTALPPPQSQPGGTILPNDKLSGEFE